MTLDMFDVGSDPDRTEYVYQAIDELAKSHEADNSGPANAGRMYEQPGKVVKMSNV